MKRLVVGVFVSALTVVGVAPAASAATSRSHTAVAVVKAKKPKVPKAIDWDAAKPAPKGGLQAQGIDWD
jgi:hypothetical protein